MKTVTMKGQTSNNLGLIVVDSERPLFPEFNEDYRQVEGRDIRSHHWGELHAAQVRVRFLKKNDSSADWLSDRRAIVSWLFSKEEHEIAFDDEPDHTFVGKVTGTDIPENYKPDVSFWVTFTLHPFRYGATISRPLTSGTAEVVNAGTYETPYTLTITPTATAQGFTLTINDNAITYNGVLLSGHPITVDADALEVRVGDELKVKEVDGGFALLQGGVNTISLDIPADVSITYTERSL